jgi:hypothetical protein
VQRGVPLLIAQLILGVVAVIALLVLLYVAFGLAMLLMVVGVLYIVAKNPALLNNNQEPKWRDGYAGYGLYRGNVRIDPYDIEG